MSPSPQRRRVVRLLAGILCMACLMLYHQLSLGTKAAASYRYGAATSNGGQESPRLVVLRDDAACSPQPDSNRTRQVVHGMQPLHFDVPSNSSAASLFYASLQHSSGAWYGCYLKWTDSNGLRCHGSENLPAGLWGVQVYLYRRPGKKFIQMQSTDPSQVYGEGMLAFLEKLQVDHFDKWKEYFDYTVSSIGCALLDIHQSSEHRSLKPFNRQEAQLESTGMWLPLGQSNGTNWQGVPEEVVDSASDRSRDMHHAFRPFNGKTYRHFTAVEMKSCLVKHKVALIGDSRTRQFFSLAYHLVTGLEVNGSEARGSRYRYPRVMRTNDIPNFGLASLLKDPQRSTLRRHLLEGDTVLLNSLMHDLADFGGGVTVDMVHRYWDPALCGNCSASSTPAECGCCGKPGAVQRYASNLSLLRSLIDDAVAERTSQGLTPPKVYWLSIPKRPPTMDPLIYPWQTPDVIDSLYDMAAETLSSYSHVDLRPHLQSAPPHWWDDNLHWAGVHRVNGTKHKETSLFHYTSLQIILNHVCS